MNTLYEAVSPTVKAGTISGRPCILPIASLSSHLKI
jgi:hypothetical protein